MRRNLRSWRPLPNQYPIIQKLSIFSPIQLTILIFHCQSDQITIHFFSKLRIKVLACLYRPLITWEVLRPNWIRNCELYQTLISPLNIQAIRHFSATGTINGATNTVRHIDAVRRECIFHILSNIGSIRKVII